MEQIVELFNGVYIGGNVDAWKDDPHWEEDSFEKQLPPYGQMKFTDTLLSHLLNMYYERDIEGQIGEYQSFKVSDIDPRTT